MMRRREQSGGEEEYSKHVFSPGTVMVHAAYTPLTDAAVMRSGRSVGFTTTAHRPPLTALKRAGRQLHKNAEIIHL